MIIVTGAAGFIGSQIALNLMSRETLSVVDHKNAFHDRKYIDPAMKQIQFIDAQDEFLRCLPEIKDVTWIIHMGAITNTAESDLGALKKWNVDYSKSIWGHCTARGINLIYASSAATYGDGAMGFSDDHKGIADLKPLNPYGQSKQEVDRYVLSQKKTPPHWYGLKFFNVYGPNESHKGRMASAIWHGYNEIKKTGAMTLFKSHDPRFKDGEQARDFVYINDVLQIIDLILAEKPASGIYNVGTGKAGTFMELATSLFGALKKPMRVNWVDTPVEFRKAYQYKTEAMTAKIRSAGFKRSFTSLDQGVAEYLKSLV